MLEFVKKIKTGDFDIFFEQFLPVFGQKNVKI